MRQKGNLKSGWSAHKDTKRVRTRQNLTETNIINFISHPWSRVVVWSNFQVSRLSPPVFHLLAHQPRAWNQLLLRSQIVMRPRNMDYNEWPLCTKQKKTLSFLVAHYLFNFHNICCPKNWHDNWPFCLKLKYKKQNKTKTQVTLTE